MTWKRALVIGALFMGAMLLLASCGDDDDSSETTDGGASGEVEIVMSIQRDLAQLGYYEGEIDGAYGSETEDAVRRFQEDYGLTVDGRYGPETDAAIREALGAQETETVKEIQTLLSERGWYEGEIDGIYGEATIASVMDFQEYLGVTVDGIVGPETIEAFRAQCEAEDTCLKEDAE